MIAHYHFLPQKGKKYLFFALQSYITPIVIHVRTRRKMSF